MPDTRTAIVTGASRGIGRAIATALATERFNVVVNYHSNEAAARECADLVTRAGSQAICVRADIANLDHHARLLDETLRAFGSVEVLVNNAGIAPRVRADLLELSPGSYDELLATNLRGPLFLTQRVANHMLAMKSADAPPRCVVNISSISAFTVSVNRGEYCIAKAGLSMMTQLFAARLAEHGVHVYEVRPGIIATDMTSKVKEKYDAMLSQGVFPVRRWGQPDDVAKAVVACATGALPYSTGQVLDVDGGFHIPRL